MQAMQPHTQAKSPSMDSLSWNNWSLEPSTACSALRRSVRCQDLRVFASTDEQMTRSPCSTPSTWQSLTRTNSGTFSPATASSVANSSIWGGTEVLGQTGGSSSNVNSCKRTVSDVNYDDSDESNRSKKPRFSHNLYFAALGQ